LIRALGGLVLSHKELSGELLDSLDWMQHNLCLTSANTTISGVATEIKMVCEDLAANAKVGSKPLDEALNKPHNSASLLLQTKRFARRESGESQRISVLTVL
jgi:hypothetical protein